MIAVYCQVVAMRFQRRVDQVFIRHHIELEPLVLLLGIDIKDSEQHPKSVFLVQNPDLH